MNVTREETACRTPGPATMRAAATWFLDRRTLLRHESLSLWSRDLLAFLEHLTAQTEELASRQPLDDVPGRVALAGVGEARRRMQEPGAAGLKGETERVRRLARSVVSLCDHLDALAGLRMCVACDKPVEEGEGSRPYDKVSPSGGALSAGHVHLSCAGAPRV